MEGNSTPSAHLQTRRHAYGVREHVEQDGYTLTEPEAKGVAARRNWTRAQVVPEIRAELRLWEDLQTCAGLTAKGVAAFLGGHPDYTDEERAILAAAAPLIDGVISTVRKRARKAAKQARKERKAARGS